MLHWKQTFLDMFTRFKTARHLDQKRRAAKNDLHRLSDRQLRDIGIERRQIPEIVDGMTAPAKPSVDTAKATRHSGNEASVNWSGHAATPCCGQA